MALEVNNVANAGAGMAAPRPAASAPPSKTSAVQAPEAPKVQAPKPVAIHFDRAEVQQTIQEAVHLLNQQINSSNRGLGFHIDASVGGPVVTVRSTSTGEVVRQIPNETIINIAHNIDHMKGLIFNKKNLKKNPVHQLKLIHTEPNHRVTRFQIGILVTSQTLKEKFHGNDHQHKHQCNRCTELVAYFQSESTNLHGAFVLWSAHQQRQRRCRWLGHQHSHDSLDSWHGSRDSQCQ